MFPDHISIPLQPKQQQLDRLLEESEATWDGAGGSRGGAKSHGVRGIMFKRRLKWPGTWGIIIRKTYEDLWDEHITKYFRDWPFLRECYNDKHREINLPNGGGIKFGYAQHKGDMEAQFQGKGFMDVFVDEATKHTQADLTFCRTFCRWPNVPETSCKLLLTMNPGGVSHAFIKRIFIKREYQGDENPRDYAFLQMRAWDNVEWSRQVLKEDGFTVKQYYEKWTDSQRFKYFIERTDYGKKLNALPQALRVGNLLGDWDRYSGQYFDIFTQKHVQDRRSVIQPWYPRWLSLDWGFAHHTAIYGHVMFPDQHVHTYRELLLHHMTPKQIAEQVALRFGDDRIEKIYCSPDANRRISNPETVMLQLSDAFEAYGLPRCSKANNQRVAGWVLWYQLMSAGLWSCDPGCKVLIDTLPSATRDEDDLEDVLKVDVEGGEGNFGDDSWDSCLVAGTLVLTKRGEIPIEIVNQDDEVFTREGWRRVLRSWKTDDSAIVYKITLSDGRILIGTGNHPIFVGGQFIRLDSVRYGVIMPTWEKTPSGLMELNLQDIRETTTSLTEEESRVSVFCTGANGRREMVRYQRDIKSIIGMKTLLTIGIRIWNVFQRTNISRSMRLAIIAVKNTWRRWLRTHVHGIVLQRVYVGTVRMAEKFGSCVRIKNIFASNASNLFIRNLGQELGFAHLRVNRSGVVAHEWMISRNRANDAEKSSYQTDTKESGSVPARALSVEKETETRAVYNLEIENTSEYLANGILVHNCRYGLLSRIEPAQKPIELRVAERVAGLTMTSRQHAIPRILRDEEQNEQMAPWSMRRPSRRVEA
jgi:phage terminase large subunit